MSAKKKPLSTIGEGASKVSGIGLQFYQDDRLAAYIRSTGISVDRCCKPRQNKDKKRFPEMEGVLILWHNYNIYTLRGVETD
jgi:hypothetical protein